MQNGNNISDIQSKNDKEKDSYLDLHLLGKIVTYALIVLIVLGLAFLTGIVFWILRHIFGI
ncbi:hypothetical protein A3K80_04605 [Candidatus Bathyarchaeota archaeon RBG_13_38_9]|nr:MAG: hypothetical protein A3K80_04605 [Candidatus Bathyarchaeota archaeon RBG_13_38_9]